MGERVIWWQRPRLRTDEEEARERKVSFLELFFDLVFVVVIAELAHGLAEHVDARGVLTFAGLFVPVWWLWIGFTFYTERFESEDVSHRLFTFAYMVPVAVLAIFVHDAAGAASGEFAVTYAVLRSLLVVLWLRGGYHDRSARGMTNRLAVGFSLSVLLFLVSVFVPAPWRFVLWGGGLAIDLVTPFFTLGAQRSLPRFSTSRLPERFGLFTIIVLGEGIVGVVAGLAERRDLSLVSGTNAVAGLAIAFGVWWLYFDHVGKRPARAGLGPAFARNYLHLPLTLAITAIGVGLLNVVAHEGEALPPAVSWLLGGALAASLVSIVAIGSVLDHGKSDLRAVRRVSVGLLLASAAALGLAAVGSGLGPTGLLAGLVLVLGLAIAFTGLHRVAGRPTAPP